jgi:hypothetical protein
MISCRIVAVGDATEPRLQLASLFEFLGTLVLLAMVCSTIRFVTGDAGPLGTGCFLHRGKNLLMVAISWINSPETRDQQNMPLLAISLPGAVTQGEILSNSKEMLWHSRRISQ